jgi:hypothetical protein
MAGVKSETGAMTSNGGAVLEGCSHITRRSVSATGIAITMALALAGCWETTTTVPAPELAAVNPRDACPAQSFSAFIDAFAESAELQRRYTRIPLEHGRLDLDMAIRQGASEDQAFTTRTIHSFDEIPFLDRKDGGRIFPSRKKRLKKHFEIRMEPDDERHSNHVIAAIYIPDTGVWVQFRFMKTENCWNLAVVDDRST